MVRALTDNCTCTHMFSNKNYQFLKVLASVSLEISVSRHE